MHRVVTIEDAIRDIAALLAAAEAGQTVEIRRDGNAVAVITPAQKATPSGGLRSRGYRNR